jgi:hypothetical protein
MNAYTLTIVVSEAQTRLLLTQGPDELMRAVLPPASRVRNESSGPQLLRGIASWLDKPLHIVLCADGEQSWSCLGLTDGLGCALNSLFYTVQVVDRGARRRRGRRLRGIGDFRQLHLLRRMAAEGGAS